MSAGTGAQAPPRCPLAVRALLFDLDGTLVDSAPDLAAAANRLRADHGLGPLPLAVLRPHGGSGARGMLAAGLGRHPGSEGYDSLRDRFLALYEEEMLRRVTPFAGVPALLATARYRGLGLGIVTNKARRYAEPITQALGLMAEGMALVGGDCTPHRKPHPAPLLEAARRLGVEAAHCVYVGDDPRDIAAGRAAGMTTLAAAWGYLGVEAPPQAWGADAVLADPAAVLNWLDLA